MALALQVILALALHHGRTVAAPSLPRQLDMVLEDGPSGNDTNWTMPEPVDITPPPAEYLPQPQGVAGPGGDFYQDSPRFRFYSRPEYKDSAANALPYAEGAYDCFVNDLGWRSPGLSWNLHQQDKYFKTNFYITGRYLDGGQIGEAGGLMHSDGPAGAAWLEMAENSSQNLKLIIHEWGHALHYHQRRLMYLPGSSTWGEALANWVSETYLSLDTCAAARARHGHPEPMVSNAGYGLVANAYKVIVDGRPGSQGNYYEAWPFLTYLTNNPDGIPGLGEDAVRRVLVDDAVDDETPLHTLDRTLSNAGAGLTAGDVVARYWTRMSFWDIGQASLRIGWDGGKWWAEFKDVEEVDASPGDGSSNRTSTAREYQVVPDRAPRYMGANVISLRLDEPAEGEEEDEAEVAVTITSKSIDRLKMSMAINDPIQAETRYVQLEKGVGSIKVGRDQEVSLIVANAPDELMWFNGWDLEGSEADAGVQYSLSVSGASARIGYFSSS